MDWGPVFKVGGAATVIGGVIAAFALNMPSTLNSGANDPPHPVTAEDVQRQAATDACDKYDSKAYTEAYLTRAEALAQVHQIESAQLTARMQDECPTVLAEIERISQYGRGGGGGPVPAETPNPDATNDPEYVMLVRVVTAWQDMGYIASYQTVCPAWKTSHEQAIDKFVTFAGDDTLDRDVIEEHLLGVCSQPLPLPTLN